MAVLDAITVEIEVDGQIAREYENDEAEMMCDASENKTTYVEAQSDKEFAVVIKVAPSFDWGKADYLVARPRIDGRRFGGVCLPRGRHATGRIAGEWSGSGNHAALYKFAFAKLETRDIDKSDKLSEFKDKYHSMGTITVECSREQRLDAPSHCPDFDAKKLVAIPEKALKGRPLEVATTFKKTFGHAPPRAATAKIDLRPVAAIHFKYRTRKALQSLLIIERSPSPVPLGQRDPEHMTREELEEVVRQQRLVKQENGPVKQEKRPRAETKPPTMPWLKSSKGANGQVIYHLESDDDEPVQLKKKNSEVGGRSSAPDEEAEVIAL